jgi:hypothetical protein
MTAEELALLGYQPGQTASPALNAAQAFVTPQDLQQFAAMAGNPGAGAPDPSSVYQQPAFIDMAALDSIGALPPSDPNGFTSNQPFVGATASGQPVVLPPGTAQVGAPGVDPSQIGSAADTSPANGQFAPGSPQDTTQQSQQSTKQAPANQNLATALGFPQFSDWAKASGLPRQVMPEERKVILEKYLDQQKDFMARQDPEKVLQTKKLVGEIAAQQTSAANASQEQVEKINTKQVALDQVNDSISKIDALISHPGREWISGKTSIFPNAPGSNGSDAQALYNQVKSQAFLAGRDKLRGTGSLSDMESKMAGEAQTRLNTRQTEPEFLKTLGEMKSYLETGRDRLAKQIDQMPKPADANIASTQQAQTSSGNAPVIRTTARGTFRSIGNGQWVQIK